MVNNNVHWGDKMTSANSASTAAMYGRVGSKPNLPPKPAVLAPKPTQPTLRQLAEQGKKKTGHSTGHYQSVYKSPRHRQPYSRVHRQPAQDREDEEGGQDNNSNKHTHLHPSLINTTTDQDNNQDINQDTEDSKEEKSSPASIAAKAQRSLSLLEEARRKLEHYNQHRTHSRNTEQTRTNKLDSSVLDNYKHYVAVPLSHNNENPHEENDW